MWKDLRSKYLQFNPTLLSTPKCPIKTQNVTYDTHILKPFAQLHALITNNVLLFSLITYHLLFLLPVRIGTVTSWFLLVYLLTIIIDTALGSYHVLQKSRKQNSNRKITTGLWDHRKMLVSFSFTVLWSRCCWLLLNTKLHTTYKSRVDYFITFDRKWSLN